jgi:hypothetical protein
VVSRTNATGLGLVRFGMDRAWVEQEPDTGTRACNKTIRAGARASAHAKEAKDSGGKLILTVTAEEMA